MEPTLLRPDAEIAGGYVTFGLGGEQRVLPVLPIRDNRVWTALFESTVRDTIANVGNLNTLDEVVGALNGNIDTMLDLLVAYDSKGNLPGKEWIDQHATDREVYEAIKKVTDAAFPLGSDLVKNQPMIAASMAMEMVAAVRKALRSSTSTKPSAPPMAGRRRASKRRSPTSN